MIYDWEQMGARIRKERQEKGFTQGALAKYLHLSAESRQSINNYENGKRLPAFEDFLSMLALFECEAGYLLCEYDCKTKDATNITAKTGLSEKAINKIVALNNSSISEVMITLSKIIEHENFEELLRAIHIHIANFNTNRYKMNTSDRQEIAKYMECRETEVDNYMRESSKSLITSKLERIVSEIKWRKWQLPFVDNCRFLHYALYT